MKSSSHLTRAVFRALVASRPYVSRECLRRSPSVLSPPAHITPSVAFQQRRTFLESLLGDDKRTRSLAGPKQSIKDFDAAVGKLVDLLRARRSRSRTPAHDELTEALRSLLKTRHQQNQPLTRNEVYLATETYKHLQERDLILTEYPESLLEQDLLLILDTLAIPAPKERFRGDIRALTELVVVEAKKTAPLPPDFENAYITILATTGSALEARDHALSTSWPPDRNLILNILKGLISEARDADFWSLLEKWELHFDGLDSDMHEALVLAFVQADRVFDAQRLFDKTVLPNNEPTTECIRQMLEFLTRYGKLNSAEELANMLTDRPRDESVISSLILWHTAKDRRFEHLRQLVHALLQSSHVNISMNTFNHAIEYALTCNNPTLAQAIQELATAEGFQPDGKTYALRLQHAVDRVALEEARALYEQLVREDIPTDNFDLKVLNKYLTVLCFSHRPSYELIMRVTDNLLDRGAELDVDAISGLCHTFLQRGDIDDAVSLLRHRIDYLPVPDRVRIAKVFQSFIVDPNINPQRAFNAYELFRIAFPETSCHERLPIMQSFFDRKRADLACQVFAHMREADPADPPRPDALAYTKCFEGIAQCRDVDGLQSVYNMLKLDLQVELTTRIRNGIMLAHIACQTPWSAIIDHFYKIMDSREGPSYSTFEVALRACETWPPYGSFEARKIIAVMQSWNLEITKPLYDNYVGVLAGQCEFENTVELIENMENDIGEPPDAFTIGTFYNAIPWQFRKDEVEKWAKQAYPDLWAELVSYGEEIDEEWDVRYFRIDRSIDIDDPPLFAAGEWKPELQRKVQAQIEPLPVMT